MYITPPDVQGSQVMVETADYVYFYFKLRDHARVDDILHRNLVYDSYLDPTDDQWRRSTVSNNLVCATGSLISLLPRDRLTSISSGKAIVSFGLAERGGMC